MCLAVFTLFCPIPDRARKRLIRRVLAVAGILGVVAASPVVGSAETTYRSNCHVTDNIPLEGFGRDGKAARLSRFSCRIKGGPLDGAIVTGTNIWDMSDQAGGTLLGSIAIAQRKGASVMYEVRDVVRRVKTRDGRIVGWDATSQGVYTAASGSAAPLAGKTFRSVTRFSNPRTYTISSTIDD
jgi:hypothetical protein